MNKFLRGFLSAIIILFFAAGLMSTYAFAQEEEGWCCKDGYVFKATKDQCLEKGGKFFLTEEEAIKFCESGGEGWCCLDGMVFPATPEICKEKGGVYFATEAEAKKFCEEGGSEEGWCCLDGVVFPATPEQCKRKGGSWYPTKAEALKNCEEAGKLPDLQVVGIFLTKKCTVAVKVRNNGPGVVPDSVWTIHTPKSSSVYIRINGKPWGGATIWKFDAGKNLKMPGGTAVYYSSLVVKGEAKIVATVDHTLQVTETNETNNKLGKVVKCGLKTLKPRRIK